MNILINWEKVFPIIDKMSVFKVYIGIVSGITEDYKGDFLWFSNEENRRRVGWRWQIAESTVKVAISHLTKLNLIKVQNRGTYIVNKEYLNK